MTAISYRLQPELAWEGMNELIQIASPAVIRKSRTVALESN